MKIKTKIKSLLLISLLFFVNTDYVSAGFGSVTRITGETYIDKVHGENRTLTVYEDIIINPFAGRTIVENQQNGVTTSYSVDGLLFRNGHPLWRTDKYTTNWVTDSDTGIQTRIEYRQHSYMGKPREPRQSLEARRYYRVNFNYDTTPPVGGDLELFNDENGLEPFSYNGGWINTPKFYTMYCEDPETGCKCSSNDSQCEIYNGRIRLIPQLLGHLSEPTATFFNTVDLRSDVVGNLPGGTNLLYDQENPEVLMYFGEDIFVPVSERRDFRSLSYTNVTFLQEGDNILDGENTIGKLHYRVNTELEFLAQDNLLLHFVIRDRYQAGGLSGVSGLESLSIDIRRKNEEGNYTQNIYANSENFEPYNIDGGKEQSDLFSLSLDENFIRTSGDYEIEVNAFDYAGNHTRVLAYFKVYPDHPSQGHTTISVEEIDTFDNQVLANNYSHYRYTIRLRDKYSNPIYNQSLNTIVQDISGYENGKTILRNMINLSGASALRLTTPNGLITDSNGELIFNLYSHAPGDFSQRFRLNYNIWDDSYNKILTQEDIYLGGNLTYDDATFSHIFSGSIGIEGNELPQIGKQQKYNIDLENPSSLAFSNGSLLIGNNTLNFSTPHRFINVTINDNTIRNDKLNVSFTGSINVSDNNSALVVPQLEINTLPVQYTISGVNVRYPLPTLSNDFCDIDTLTTLGVSIVGTIQGSGRIGQTSQGQEITDISASDIRTSIRQNAINSIRGRSGSGNGDILNNIRYVNGSTVTISGNQVGYETLIVRNGNVFINGDITDTLGIIVIKDTGYDARTDYNDVGNVYIGNNVSEIHAAIYADGAFRSADVNGNSYSDSNLDQSLYVRGTLFTRNTIGGAVGANNNFLLPGGRATNNYTLAEIYDLNFVRKTNLCESPHYSLRIEYDPSIIQNPPAGFRF